MRDRDSIPSGVLTCETCGGVLMVGQRKAMVTVIVAGGLKQRFLHAACLCQFCAEIDHVISSVLEYGGAPAVIRFHRYTEDGEVRPC